MRVLLLALLVLGGAAIADDAAPARAAIAALLTDGERPDAATAARLAEQGALLLDVRSIGEWNESHAHGAVLLPWRKIEAHAGDVLPGKDVPVITYCAVGMRAWIAARALREAGYANAVAMRGGLADLERAGWRIEDPDAE